MKGLIQRVTSASVVVDGKVVSSIGKGLCVLVGIHREDAPKHADWLAKKILSLRLFDGENDKRWDKSVKEKQLEVLCVSQFTLDWVMKGNKPDFHLSMSPEESEPFYKNFIQMMETQYSKDKVKNGVFGAMMEVNIQNDGPVTLMLETPDNLPDPKSRKPQPVSKKTANKVKSEPNATPSEEGSQTKDTLSDNKTSSPTSSDNKTSSQTSSDNRTSESSRQRTSEASGDAVPSVAKLTVQ